MEHTGCTDTIQCKQVTNWRLVTVLQSKWLYAQRKQQTISLGGDSYERLPAVWTLTLFHNFHYLHLYICSSFLLDAECVCFTMKDVNLSLKFEKYSVGDQKMHCVRNSSFPTKQNFSLFISKYVYFIVLIFIYLFLFLCYIFIFI